MTNYLYYYKRTTYQPTADYYNISQGIAGYKQPQHKGMLLLAGSVEDLEDYLDNASAVGMQRRMNRTNRMPLN